MSLQLLPTVVALSAIIAITCFSAVPVRAVTPDNFLQNGSFEDYTPGQSQVPSYWKPADSGSLNTSGEHYIGATSAELVGDGRLHLWFQRVTPPAVQSLQLSAFVRAADAVTIDPSSVQIVATIKYKNAPATALTELKATAPPGTYDWTRLEAHGETRSDFSIESVTVTIGGRLTSGRMLFDNLILSEARDTSPTGLLSAKVEDLISQLDRVGDVDSSVARAKEHLLNAKSNLASNSPDLDLAKSEWILSAQAISKPAWTAMYPDAMSQSTAEAHMIFHGHGTTREECDRNLDTLQKAHANAAFLSLGSWAYAAYHSDILPPMPGYEKFDSLGYFIREAHRRNIKVFGYIAALYGSSTLPADNRNIYTLHPDWFAKAGPDPDMPKFPDPANPNVVRFVGDIFCELVAKYDLDGVGLDYLRYPTPQSLNFDSLSRDTILNKCKVDILDGNPWNDPAKTKTLQAFRMDAIAILTQKIRSRFLATKPTAKLFGCLLPDPDEAQLYGQSWEKIGQIVDYITPMNYGETSKDFTLLNKQAMLAANARAVLIPAVGGMPDVHQAWTISTWAARISLQHKAGGAGVVIYRIAELDPAVAAFLGNGPFANQAGFPSSLK
jgi:hypothetical protein